ncbi:MAG: nucleotidyltransferase family protein, partial [Bacteroidota bacterium]
MAYLKELEQMVWQDHLMMDCLFHLRECDLPDSWIGAGFVRNKVWDVLHEKETSTPLNDVDVIFFNPTNPTENREKQIEARLQKGAPHLLWSAKNQARMHLKHGHTPYRNCEEAISYWVETATCVAVRLDEYDQIDIIAPHGLEDLFNGVIRKNPT